MATDKSADGLPSFVDAHHHLWDTSKHSYPKLYASAKEALPRAYGTMGDLLSNNYTVQDFLKDAAGTPMVKSVHVQCSNDPQETAWLQAASDDPASKGFPHGIVCWMDLLSAGAERILADQATFKNFRGIRNTVAAHSNPVLHRPHAYYLDVPRWQDNLALLPKYNASFDFAIYANQTAKFSPLVKRYPKLQFIFCHLGYPADQTPEGLKAWRAQMTELAQYPNMAVKLSGFGIFDQKWTTESIRPLVEFTIEKFGPDRCMVASNFPVDKVFSTWKRYWDSLNEVTKQYSDDERVKMFRGTAERLYRI